MKQKIEKNLYLEIEKCSSGIEKHHVRCQFFKPPHCMSFRGGKQKYYNTIVLKSDFKLKKNPKHKKYVEFKFG